MEVAGSPLFVAAASSDVDEEVRRGAILLMGLSSPWIPQWLDDSSSCWSAYPPASAEGGEDEKPSTSAVAWRPHDFPDWGRRRKRSRIGVREAEKKVRMRRTSPQSPLEGYSSASASGGEEGTRWSPPSHRVARSSSSPAGVAVSISPAFIHAPRGAAAAVAFPGDGFHFPTKAMVDSHAASLPNVGHVVRPAVKKLKKVELKAQEKRLLEERSKIQQELQELGRAVEVVKAERRELELRLKSPKTVAKAADALKVSQDIAPGTPHMLTIPSSESKQKGHMEIPDLNEPLPVFSN